MSRRYRKKIFKRFKIKDQTLYTILSIILISLSILIWLSFLQQGSVLFSLNSISLYLFGWGSLVLPLVLITFSLLFLKIKTPFSKANISFGMLLSFICLLALTQNGFIGEQIWGNFVSLISGVGAFIVLLGMFFIGIIVLFNTSLEEILNIFLFLYKSINKLIESLFHKKSKSLFVEKIPIKPPTEYKKPETTLENKIPSLALAKKMETSQISMLNTGVLSNLPENNIVWEFPPLNLLGNSPGQKADRGDMKKNAHVIEKTLESFGISAKVVEVNLGPAVTQYALEIALGTKLSKITALSNDLALALAAPTGQIRIDAPIPGRSLVGIEIPNRSLEFVTLKHMLSSDILKKNQNKLLVALGLDVSGQPVIANIAKMPHVLIAGTTGSGKSVLINSWIASILFRTTPAEVKLILVDPKRVELTGYNGIPHLLTPVIVEPDKILSALRWAIQEMEKRYKLFSEVGVRNIEGYNELSGFQAIPYIVIFIDELADLMAYSAVEVEDSICRLAQMARATGIHLVISTQHPSVDVITGLIKANLPSRLAFNVSTMIDSRVILDTPGAEKLLGKGDMLYIQTDQAKPTRIQGTYVSENEVRQLVDFFKAQKQHVEYEKEVTSIPVSVGRSSTGAQIGTDGKDEKFNEAVSIVCQYDRASASLLQRRLSIGYARAARILDQLEAEGIVGAGEGSKPREVRVKSPDEYFANQTNPADH
ncbi:DNA translocase FtsK [Candidatus Gottesmanbacteria bacterium]|nr:DNA translocase FtsK [Candidatus Gottesmanbacteria bacterium]